MSKSALEIEGEIWKALRVCSLSAKGLWCVMRKVIEDSTRPGYLRQNGRPMSPLQLAREAGCNAAKVTRLLQDLIDAGLIIEEKPETRAPHLQRLHEIRARGAARVQKFREKKPELQTGGMRSSRGALRNTPCNADVTPMLRDEAPPPVSLSPTPPISLNPHLPGEVSPDPSATAKAAAASGGNPRRKRANQVLSDEQAAVSKQFRDWWTFDAYPKRFGGVVYEFQGGEDGRAVHKQILPSNFVGWDLEKAKALAITYLDAPAAIVGGKDRTLFWLGKQINFWISQTAARLRGGRMYEQRISGKHSERYGEFTGARREIPEFGKAG